MNRRYFVPMLFPVMDAFINRVACKIENRVTYFITVEKDITKLYERQNILLEAGNGVLKVSLHSDGLISKVSLSLVEFLIRLLIGYPIFIWAENRITYFTEYSVLGSRDEPIVNTMIYKASETKLLFTPKQHIKLRANQYKEAIGYLKIEGRTTETMKSSVHENMYCFYDKMLVFRHYGMFFPYFSPPNDLEQMAQYVQRIYFADRNFFNAGRGAFTYLWHTNPVLEGVKWIKRKQ